MGQLTKESSIVEIKSYFNNIHDLLNQDNNFPVSLDDVWPLVYVAKCKAVEALKNNSSFIQHIDYQVLNQTVENPKGGRPRGEYWLSVPCLEFFIARKKREVFEVYRQVFHASMDKAIEDKKQEEENTLDTSKVRLINHITNMQISDKDKVVLIQKLMADDIKRPDLKQQDKTSTPILMGEGEVYSATKLLKMLNIGMDIYTFNNLMQLYGYMVKEDGNVRAKMFNVLTEKGLKYGVNADHPYFKGGTYPKYYRGSFNELVDLLIAKWRCE